MSVTIKIPKGKTIPPILRSLSDDELYEGLVIGLTVRDTILTQRADENTQREIAALRQQSEEEITKLRAENVKKEEELKARLEKRRDEEIALLKSDAEKERIAAQDRLLEIQRSKERLESELSIKESVLNSEFTIVKQKELAAVSQKYNNEVARLEGQVSEIQSRKQLLEQEFSTNITKAIEQERRSSERLVEAKESELARSIEERNQERIMSQNQILALTEKIQTLTDTLSRKPTSMKEKGTAFELLMIDYMKRHWSNLEGFAIRHEATTGHKGDIWMDLGLGDRFHTVLIESKDYGGTLPTKEVTKFFKDVKTNHAVKIGILIVKDADITGYNTHGDTDFAILEGKLHIFVNYFERYDISSNMNMLMGWIRYWEQIEKPATDNEDKAEAIRIIQKLVEKSQKYKTELATHLHHMDDMCAFLNQEAKDTHMALQEALRGLQHGVGDNIITDSALFEDVTGNPKKQERIRVIQDVAEEDMDSVILLSDLAKRVAEKTRLAEKTVKEHIESVIKPDYIEKKPGMSIKLRGLRLKPDSPV